MKKLLLISMFAGMLPLSMVAQVDDLYFVPKKKSAEKVTDNYGMPTDVYYSGSDRSIDEYNRRGRSTVEVLDNDTTANDIIVFSPEKGVYPSDSLASDSVSDEDFKLTKRMSRFEDYRLTDNEASGLATMPDATTGPGIRPGTTLAMAGTTPGITVAGAGTTPGTIAAGAIMAGMIPGITATIAVGMIPGIIVAGAIMAVLHGMAAV
jgi:hypothetical protein